VYVSSMGNASAGQEELKIDFCIMEKIFENNSMIYMFTDVQ
jgi:hypothetical protein